MGRAAAWDLARQPGMERVTLADRDAAALEHAADELARLLAQLDKPAAIATERVDLDNTAALPALLAPHDVALSSADYRFNETLTRAAIAAKTHLCDLGGNLFVVERQLALDETARQENVTIIPDCGLAPGMAGLLAALGVARLDSADSVKIRVGGLPAHPVPPLNYKLVFSVRGLTNEYLEPAEVLKDGKLARVPSLAEPESIEFPHPFGTLEAFNTSGGSSTLPHTLAGKIKDLDYKTIRYPGHMAVFAGMQALGLFGEQPVGAIVPRVFTEQMLEHTLQDDDTDVVLLRVTVAGKNGDEAGRLVFEIIDRHDAATGHSAMARTTAYPAAVVAYMLATGAITKRGVLPGELAVPLDDFAAAVRARGIDVQERWER